MFASTAYAAAPAGGAAGGAMLQFLPLIFIFVIFYFLLIRPQQKRAKQQKEMLAKLQKGDYVMTSGGFLGRIHDISNDILTIDLGETKVRMPRSYVATTYDPKQLEQTAAAAERKNA